MHVYEWSKFNCPLSDITFNNNCCLLIINKSAWTARIPQQRCKVVTHTDTRTYVSPLDIKFHLAYIGDGGKIILYMVCVVNRHCRLDKYKAELRHKREQQQHQEQQQQQIAAESTESSSSSSDVQPASPATGDAVGHRDDAPATDSAAATTTTTQLYIDWNTMQKM